VTETFVIAVAVFNTLTLIVAIAQYVSLRRPKETER
jgi:hypothetical protein